MPDEYPKDIREAVSELRRRGYDASVAKLQYMMETEEVTPGGKLKHGSVKEHRLPWKVCG